MLMVVEQHLAIANGNGESALVKGVPFLGPDLVLDLSKRLIRHTAHADLLSSVQVKSHRIPFGGD